MARRAARSGWITALSLACIVAGCNAIFGVEAGIPKEISTTCPPERPTTCDPAATSGDDCCSTGRSCQGGTCSASGECGPVVVSESPDNETIGLVVVTETVVWSSGDSHKLYSAPIDGGLPTVMADGADIGFDFVTGIATDGAYVYFLNHAGPGVGRVPMGGGTVELVSEVTAAQASMAVSGFARIVVGGGYVYWAMETGGVFRAPVNGALPAPAERIATPGAAYGVALDATHFYWGDAEAGTIQRVSVDDVTTPQTIISDGQDVRTIALDEDRIYWTSSYSVLSALKNGKDRITLAADEERPFSVLSDGRDVYWTATGENTGKGHLRRTPREGGAIATLSQNDSMYGMAGLAEDCDTVYWIDSKQLAVIKATK